MEDMWKNGFYSDKVMDHFTHPRNVGVIDHPDGYSKVGSPVCGDVMEMGITVKDDIITDIKFRTFGCAAAVASSSMITELVKGKHVDEAMKVTCDGVVRELNGLPIHKVHCSDMATDALHNAIRDYKRRKNHG